MELRTERIESAVILHLDGRLSAESDTGWMRDAMLACTDNGVRHALIELSGVRQLDCAGLGQLLRLREQVHGARRTFGLVDVERRQRAMLELSGLIHVFRVFCDRDAAVSALGIVRQQEPVRTPVCGAATGSFVPGRLRACWIKGPGWAEMECLS